MMMILNEYLIRSSRIILNLFCLTLSRWGFFRVEWIDRSDEKRRLKDSDYKLLLNEENERRVQHGKCWEKLRENSCDVVMTTRENFQWILSFSLTWTDCSELEKEFYELTFIWNIFSVISCSFHWETYFLIKLFNFLTELWSISKTTIDVEKILTT
jgi:hypothetical protein